MNANITEHIILVHKGNSFYLRYAIEQIRKTNKNCEIHLLGDEANAHYGNTIKQHDIKKYSDRSDELTRSYVHYSSLSYEFEIFAIQRWFIIQEFVERHNVNRFFYIDSDVMIYIDVNKEINKFSDYQIALSVSPPAHLSVSGHVSFWMNKKILNDFCDFVFDLYARKNSPEYLEMVDHYKELQQQGKGGGVCDMVLLYFFCRKRSKLVYNIQTEINDSLYDTTIMGMNVGKYFFQKQGYIKKIYWKNNRPYGKDIKTGKLIGFNSLHFQGDNKDLMPYFSTYKGFYDSLRYNNIMLAYHIFMKMVRYKLRSIYSKFKS